MSLLLRSPPTPLHRATTPHHHPLCLSLTLGTGGKTSNKNLALSTPTRSTRSPCLLARASAEPALGGESGDDGKVVSGRDVVVRIGEVLSLGFPLWVGSACALALWRPPAFLWVGRGAQIVGITLTMLGMMLPFDQLLLNYLSICLVIVVKRLFCFLIVSIGNINM